LDEVWHIDGFGDFAEGFADAFLFSERECHLVFRFVPPSGTTKAACRLKREDAAKPNRFCRANY
ncbi:MAG: hypothetical protein AAFV37_10540, partial [Pseudomonadota bacterium]